MFRTIDLADWERKEIYERFQGYTYNLTVELEMGVFLEEIRSRGYKTYPALCWCIAGTVNQDRDFRYALADGQVGYYDVLNPCYTLMRKGESHLFTHMVTEYSDNFDDFHKRFLEDKEKAENGNSLYFLGGPRPGCVDITILPGTTYRSVSYIRPERFVAADTANESYVPFVTVGRYEERDNGVKMPVTGNFNHAVNDGYHAEKFFRLLQEKFNHPFGDM